MLDTLIERLFTKTLSTTQTTELSKTVVTLFKTKRRANHLAQDIYKQINNNLCIWQTLGFNGMATFVTFTLWVVFLLMNAQAIAF